MILTYMKEILLTKTLLPSLVKNTNVFLMFLFHLFIQNLFNTALEFQISVYNVYLTKPFNQRCTLHGDMCVYTLKRN